MGKKKYDGKYLKALIKAKYGTLERYCEAVGLSVSNVSRILTDEDRRKVCFMSTWDRMTAPFNLTPRQKLLIKGYREGDVKEILRQGGE